MNLKNLTMCMLLCSFIILVIALTGCNYIKEYLEQIDYATVKNKIEAQESFVLYVGNKSCSHCIDFEPKIRNVVNKYKVIVYKIDTSTMSTEEYDEFLDSIGSIGTPTVLFFRNGIESGSVNRIEGDVSKDIIINKLKVNAYIKN